MWIDTVNLNKQVLFLNFILLDEQKNLMDHYGLHYNGMGD